MTNVITRKLLHWLKKSIAEITKLKKDVLNANTSVGMVQGKVGVMMTWNMIQDITMKMTLRDVLTGSWNKWLDAN